MELGDVVCSKKNKKGKKMYRIKVIIDASAEKLIAAFENSDDITKWNTTLSKHQILKKFDNTNATISYQVNRGFFFQLADDIYSTTYKIVKLQF